MPKEFFSEHFFTFFSHKAYFEVCEKLRIQNWTYVWNKQQLIPYAYSSEFLSSTSSPIEWVGFDDPNSIAIKVKYAMKQSLAGVMLWSLDMDDFTGKFCDQGASFLF